MKDAEKELFGSLLRNRRLEFGLSTEEFAFRIGVDRNTINRIERGERTPSLDTLLKLRFNGRLSMDRLFDEYEEILKTIDNNESH
ncbi:helix-turn-helix domain-containing protein [Sutcliffiella cohnii]